MTNIHFMVLKIYHSPSQLNIFITCNFVTDYSIVAVLSYQHSIFSDRCTSSSLKCPYNVEQSALSIKPATPKYEMTTQIFRPKLQVHTSSPPTHVPTSEFYKTTSQVYEPTPRAYEPTTRIYDPSPPPYKPTSEIYGQSSLKYETTTQIDKASTSTYKPTSHTYRPSTPDHKQEQDEVLPEHTGIVTSIMNVFRFHQK